jgi:hypothetical protein
MILFNYINENLNRIKKEARLGLISCAIFRHFQIYSRYSYYVKLGNNKTNSVIYTCNDFQMEQRSVYYIIKKMESEI